MQEIKFRGLDKRGAWHYGFYWEAPDNTCYIKEKMDDSHYADFEVIKETVGQYTGLPDKNGKEIYTGDIVKLLSWRDKEVVEIKFGEFEIIESEFARGWYFCSKNQHEYPFTEFNEKYEVIGNVWENSNLLNQQTT